MAESSSVPHRSRSTGRAGWSIQAARLAISGARQTHDAECISGRLSSGLRVVLVPRPNTPTVAMRAYVRAGSRYDSEHALPDGSGQALGLAHLTEHLLFKGARLHSQRELFSAVERLGGTLDAGTSKETFVLSVVVPPDGLEAGLQVMGELLVEPALREEDFWNEKLVVLEEIRRAHDREERIFDLLAETLWQVHPLRHPVLGCLPALRALDYATLLSFYRQRFVAGNAVLVLCGSFDPAEAGRCADERLSPLPAGPEQRPCLAVEPPLEGVRSAHLDRALHQANVLVAVPTVSMGHPDRSALKVIERVLGMGGSARLYQRLREQEQLVYSVRTVTAHYEDAGFLAIHCACDPQRLPQVQRAILEEWDRLCQAGVSEDELCTAQDNYAGSLARSFETNLAVAGIRGIEGLLWRIEPFADAVRRIRAVQREHVLHAARAYLNGERYVTVTIAPTVRGTEPT